MLKKRTKNERLQLSIEKELKLAMKQEEDLRRSARKQEAAGWKEGLREKVPEPVYHNLQKAFCKAFQIVFEKGSGVSEKTYDRESIREDHDIHAFAFQVKGTRKALKMIRKSAGAANLRNMAITSAEGIGLGILGIGLPDIVLFIGVLLRGIYEIALHYGFDHDSEQEQDFILKLMEGALRKGEDWENCSREIDRIMGSEPGAEGVREGLQEQMGRTAQAFAADMLVMKFIQGLPVIGMIGGMGNPVYYHKVMKYAELKYRRRYLTKLQAQTPRT